MKIYIMTDMEGVSGVINNKDWCEPGGSYYEEGKELLTQEVNAAVEGFYAAGATEIHVVDGHGWGGVNHLLLDPRVSYLRYFLRKPYPFYLDSTYSAIAWVGQHAKAGTEYAHLPHTGSYDVLDCTINGLSVGEFGKVALCAAALGIPSIFGSGDEAFVEEARKLTGGIETVSVKQGKVPGSGDDCETDAYRSRNFSAIHLHPAVARARIREGAEKALARFLRDPESFPLLKLAPPTG
ncbi:M55 family metallopeptidase [Paenibacillus sp. CC-CFT747]|nr:M55 family metallopeptidase [Paenibacillus sp. CC-CFT747]